MQYPILHTSLLLSPRDKEDGVQSMSQSVCLLATDMQQTIRYVTLEMSPISTPQTYVIIGFVEE